MTNKPSFDFTPISETGPVAQEEPPSIYNDPALAEVDPSELDEAMTLTDSLRDQIDSPKGEPGSGANFEEVPDYPCAPGSDERDERHPFGYLDENDPDHDEMLRALKPSSYLNMVCLAGCKHYCEVLDEEPTADAQEWKALHRMCCRFHDDEGDWDITERTMYACSEFTPSPISIIGQVRRVLNWVELQHASGVVNSGLVAYRPSVLLATAISRGLKAVGIDLQRKIDLDDTAEEKEAEDA